ncbi:MAG: bifunctional fucokinase/fucose-1-phosphate guanylyltransferase [Terracidiphilus sp.]
MRAVYGGAVMYWDVVIITASSARQAELYRNELQRRAGSGMLHGETEFLVVPDPGGRRVGTGGATINALGVLGRSREWWGRHKALLLHSGGDSRRLPQYSPGGKLFGVLPSRKRPRETTTVFDETLALSAAWAEGIPNGMLAASGDVVLRFDAKSVRWDRPGVTGVAMRLDPETGSHHGVYVVGAGGQVYTFLQKPTLPELKAAGGVLEDGRVAVDIGLLRFDAEMTAALAALAGCEELPAVDLYDQITRGLTGQWNPGEDAEPFWQKLKGILRPPQRPAGFHCAVVEGEFIHAGTTRSFRALAAASGPVLDSVIGGPCEAGHEAVILECDLSGAVCASRGAILHGLTGLSGSVEVPEDTVVHQLPVEGAWGDGWVIRTYGVEDNPKQTLPGTTWFNRPILEALERLQLHSEEVWRGVEEPSLWNAALFPVTTPDDAWACARWMMGYASGYDAERWRTARRISLAESANCADAKALAEARNHRLQGIWQETALELAESGTDLRPLLANLPGLTPAAAAGRSLRTKAKALRDGGAENLTLAASHLMQAARLLSRAGFEQEAEQAESDAFACIQDAVRAGAGDHVELAPSPWQFERVHVSAPPRIDLGGGWSDTPPFCFDWGGTVLNCALEIDGTYPIEAEIRRIDEPVIRCCADGQGTAAEYRSREQLLEPCGPGSVFSIPRAALQLHGIPMKGRSLRETLGKLGGGLDIQCRVRLPIGSGLGTSSILAATVIRALAVMSGRAMDDHALSQAVMQLEQRMTTGGGWQDQAGGIFPGAKLLITGPGLRQRIRVQPVAWTGSRQAEFCEHLVLYNTGIQRMAKDLLHQVVSRYLARETATIQVLHSIKTLAVEMSYAMAEGEWKHLGHLLDRHWQLNQVLDPHTTNAPIAAILDRARPWIHGAKLAGAGGGGFLLLMARDAEAAAALRAGLNQEAGQQSAFVPYRIAQEGLRIQSSGK